MNPMTVESFDREAGLLILRAADTGQQYAVAWDDVDAALSASPIFEPTPPAPVPTPPADGPVSGAPAPDPPGAPNGPPLDPATPQSP